MGGRDAIPETWARLLRRASSPTRLVPVGDDVAANRRWVDHDVASIAEGMFGERLDPLRIDAAARERVEARLPRGWRLAAVEPGEERGLRWWIEEAEGIVGTAGMAPPWGRASARVFSLYTRPAARGRGSASRALDLLEQVAVRTHSVGISLETEWTWGGPARFYLRCGFWVRHWKRSLTLQRGPHLPRHVVRVGETHASFSILRDGAEVPLIHARRLGDRLGWDEAPAMSDPTAPHAATPTFALALALAGWPLYRSDEAWIASLRQLDVGGPEALARRIELFEAVGRAQGRVIAAPRIPNLRYRDLAELR
jgi:GNAT superfamily N-acetyltransferase